MNIMPFTQPGFCPTCAYSNTLLEDAEAQAAHDGRESASSPRLDVQTLSCPTCGRMRFVIVPVAEVTELPLAS